MAHVVDNFGNSNYKTELEEKDVILLIKWW